MGAYLEMHLNCRSLIMYSGIILTIDSNHILNQQNGVYGKYLEVVLLHVVKVQLHTLALVNMEDQVKETVKDQTKK